MANFDAQVRTSYRDVAGLVLSCTRDGIIEDVDNPGFVKEWRNDASGLPSKPAIRNPGDPAPTYLGGRYSNPRQTNQALQPTLDISSGNQRCQFDRARSTFLETGLLIGDLPDAPRQPLACAYQFTKGADLSNGQSIFSESSGTFIGFRRNGAGDAEISAGGLLTTVAGDHADGTFVYTGQAAGIAVWEIDGAAYGAGSAFPINAFLDGESMFIGRNPGGASFLDGTLDSIHMWAMELSPKTIDLIWQSVNEDGTNFATSLRAPMSVPNAIWTDITGNLALDQVDRLHPLTGLPFRFIKVSLPAAPAPHLVQVGAAVDGLVLPDSQLGGAEFVYNFVEFPGPPFIVPVITQDAGWSAVADFALTQEGHYTLEISRVDLLTPQNSGGSILVHFDVEVAP